MVIQYSLRREIDEKKEKIKARPDYYLKRSQRVKKDLRNICNVHSHWLENPQLRGRILMEQDETDSRKLRKTARESVKSIETAWHYLTKVSEPDSYKFVKPKNILNVAEIIDPINQSFRTQRATFHLKYVPPNSAKVPELVKQFCEQLNDGDLNPVEAAAMTHLTLAGIQPFLDGNKRTARLFQDAILYQADLPPAYIPSGEREIYIDLLEQALLGKQERDFESQRPFYDYIGGKVNVALDTILDDLKIR